MPLTPDDFRRIALSLPETTEKAHMAHPDFRVRGKVFATLGYPDHGCGMVKLTREQQMHLVEDFPMMYSPFNGAWGARGCTYVQLKAATKTGVREAIKLAWRNTAPADLLRAEKGSK